MSAAPAEDDEARARMMARAGERFSSPAMVSILLSHDGIKGTLSDPQALVVEPSAGDGAVLVPLVETRVRAALDRGTDPLLPLSHTYAVELQPDNVRALRLRIHGVVSALAGPSAALDSILEKNFLQGNFLTRHDSLLPCPPTCSSHADLQLPDRFDLAIGFPPSTPPHLQRAFLAHCAHTCLQVRFLTASSWRSHPKDQVLRDEIGPRLLALEDLPAPLWPTREHHSLVHLASPGHTTPFTSSVFLKAQRAWTTVSHHQHARYDHRAYMDWRCPSPRTSTLPALSLTLDPTAAHLPRRPLVLSFASEAQRRRFVAYSATKLAAYLQTEARMGTLARYLPVPDLKGRGLPSDPQLYRALRLTKSEVAQVERHHLRMSRSTYDTYAGLGVPLREDVRIVEPRRSSPAPSLGGLFGGLP